MSDLFTNSDPRLRPRAPLEDYSSVPQTVDGKRILVPTSYKVTTRGFPELYTRFMELQQKAGIAPHQLILRIDSDRVSHQDGLITFGLKAFNQLSFDNVAFALAHELGHAWREKHPHAPSVPVRVKLPAHQHTESEADLFARCLTQNARAAVQTLAQLISRDPHHAESHLRIAVVKSMKPEDCQIFLPTSTPATVLPVVLQK